VSDLILHHYWPSPFAHKIRLALALNELSWQSVEIPRVPPKPLLMPLTAGYRRTPVLQIGADIYCDTANIVREIAARSSADQLLPEAQRAKILAFGDWIDTSLFNLAARVVITSALGSAPEEFVKDRGGLYFGPNWTPDGLQEQLPAVILQLSAHLNTVESALEGSQGMFTDGLSYADLSIAYLAWFIRGRWDLGPDFINQYPKIKRILEQTEERLSDRYTDLTGEQAIEIAAAAQSSAPVGVSSPVGVDYPVGAQVSIKPQGETSDPAITGRLRFLDSARVSIDHRDEVAGDLVVHLPVSGYRITAAS